MMGSRTWRRRFAVPAAVALSLGAAASAMVLSVGSAGAATTHTPLAATDDDQPGSLRNVVEDLVANGDTVVLEAGATYVLDACSADELEISDDITIEGNGATIEQTCEDAGVITLRSASLTLKQVTIRGGNVDGGGGGVELQGEGPALTVIESTFTDNLACDEGAGIVNYSTSGSVSVIRSTISGNSSEEDTAIDMDSGGELVIVNSTITDNLSAADGAISLESDEGSGTTAVIAYSTIVRNIHGEFTCPFEVVPPSVEDDDDTRAQADGEPANLRVEEDGDGDPDSTLQIFGTVIAEPLGDAPNCGSPLDPLAETDSEGYNYSDDDSCGLDHATDVETEGVAPGLGALAANGGPTQTLVPQTGSALLNKIPVANCDDADALVQMTITTDQRGILRPQETGCEIGSVEVEPVVTVPDFTG